VTGHGNTREYIHQFKKLEHATCPCNKGDQTVDHLLNQCTLLHSQRDFVRNNVSKSGNWPVSEHELITKHLKTFFNITNSIEFDQL
jgi:hypothetical protein